jgi:predicted TIM-barrel fold metal-dependent hydrolase
MRIVDPHHHLWDLHLHSHPWLTGRGASALLGDIAALRRDYPLAEFLADAMDVDLVASVHVQAEVAREQAVDETRWLQAIADAPDSRGFPHGIVAYADLAASDVERTLEAHAACANLRGIRQILNRHPDPALSSANRDYMREDAWQRGFAALRRHGLSFDMQLYWPQMIDGAITARRHPDIQIVLDHAGMPLERDEDGIEGWRGGMRCLADCPNVAVKISGLGMVDHLWTVASIRPFVLETIEIFGVERCMLASNFPVDRLYSDYTTLWRAFDAITETLSPDERAALFHDNAIRIYRLGSTGC